jgi:hypothetical protein
MCRDDLLSQPDVAQNDECPLADDDDQHSTTRPNERLHCDDCNWAFYS